MVMVIVVVAIVVVEKVYQGHETRNVSCPYPFPSPFGPAVFICRLNPA